MGCGGAKHVQLKDQTEIHEDSPFKEKAVSSSDAEVRNDKGRKAQGFVADEYNVGKKIGEGTFGVVRRAHKVNQPEPVYAIKFIDKAMQSHDDIMREISIVMRLDHPHVVKCFSVIEEPAFTCAVMELWLGTDVASLLMELLDQNESLLEGSAVSLVKQMLCGLGYVHSMDIIHRDIKCDNYLSDRKDLSDPEVRLGLADFGCARVLAQGKRCKEDVGTPFYKSPEQMKLDYSHSADVWAVGVCFYVLVHLAFPFETPDDIMHREPAYEASTPLLVMAALRQMLDKSERDRPTAEEAKNMLSNSSLCLNTGKSTGSQNTGGSSGVFQIRKVAQKIIDRRDVLMSRCKIPKFGERTAVPLLPFEAFVQRVDGTHERLRFEWMDEEYLIKKNMFTSKKPKMKGAMTLYGSDWHDTFTDISWTRSTAAATLQAYRIDATQFPTGHGQSGLDGLVDELRSGVSQLMQDSTKKKTLVRVMRSLEIQVMVMVKNVEQILVMSSTASFINSHSKGRLPAKIWRTCETLKEAVRTVVEASGLEGSGVLLVPNLDNVSETIERSECDMYPGLELVTRRFVVPSTIISSCSTGSTRIGLRTFTDEEKHNVSIVDAHSFKLKGVRWEWWPLSKCKSTGMQILTRHDCQSTTHERASISYFFPEYPRISEKEVEGLLVDNDLDLSVIGDQTASALSSLSAEISEGYCILGVSRGQLLRIADVVVLHVEAGSSGLQLVEVAQSVENETWTHETRRPGTKKEPLEEELDTLRRICEDILGWSFDALHLNLNKTCTHEEVKCSLQFPGLPTLYRKHFYYAEVTPLLEASARSSFMEVSPSGNHKYYTGDHEDSIRSSDENAAKARSRMSSEYGGHSKSKQKGMVAEQKGILKPSPKTKPKDGAKPKELLAKNVTPVTGTSTTGGTTGGSSPAPGGKAAAAAGSVGRRERGSGESVKKKAPKAKDLDVAVGAEPGEVGTADRETSVTSTRSTRSTRSANESTKDGKVTPERKKSGSTGGSRGSSRGSLCSAAVKASEPGAAAAVKEQLELAKVRADTAKSRGSAKSGSRSGAKDVSESMPVGGSYAKVRVKKEGTPSKARRNSKGSVATAELPK